MATQSFVNKVSYIASTNISNIRLVIIKIEITETGNIK